MIRLVKKALFLAVTTTAVFAAYAWAFIGGEDDRFYRRFTSPPAPSLVVGSSRCAQGITPTVINESELQFARPLYNYCFTAPHSPYGPYYLESIKKKLRMHSDGLFIVEVNPWSLSVRKPGMTKNEFPEASRFIARMRIVNYMNPNLEYIINHYNKSHIETIWDEISGQEGSMFLEETGRLRVDVSMDQDKIQEREKRTIERYRKRNANQWNLSSERAGYLGETISFLRQHGQVFVIRVPVSEEVLRVEQAYAPAFNSMIDSVATEHDGVYLDYSDESGEYQTTDGSHLWKEDARRFTSRMLRSLERHTSE